MTTPRKLLATLLLGGFLLVTGGGATFSAFSSTTTNPGNSFAAGTVAISDNDTGTAMLALANAKPGDADTSCITLTYTGSLDASVRLYGTISGGLADYLTLTVTRGGDASPQFDDCSSFNPDSTDYIGQGPGVIYQGSLSAFPTTYAAGIVDPGTWTTSANVHDYRFVVTLANNDAAQGLSGSASFSWQARNT